MTKKNKDTSSTKKLIPAVAMLMTSAIMLTTSTYAWFTLNKEVEVTGLQMAAVAGDSLEITLGKLGVDTTGTKSTGTPDNTTFGSVGDLGWCRAEAIDSYYNIIGEIKPASSSDALNIYKIDETKVYAGGQAVNGDATVSTAVADDMSTITLDTKYNKADEKLTNKTDGTTNKGYYVDIPMWIRSNVSDTDGKDVNAWVKITDPTKDETNANGSELIKAVRVALIPVASTSSLKDSNAVTKLNYTKSGTRTVDSVASNATIFGLTSDTYNSKVLNTAGKDYNSSLVTAPTIKQAVDSFWDTPSEGSSTNKTFNPTLDGSGVQGTPIFKMPSATNDDYAAVLVVARIWIEGESTYCNDATANQDWSIDFHFEFADDTQQN